MLIIYLEQVFIIFFVSSQSYRMTSSPRGFALVISNVEFDQKALPKLDLRKGGEVDEEVLRKLFTELDYVTLVYRDLTAQVKQATQAPGCCKADSKSAEWTHKENPSKIWQTVFQVCQILHVSSVNHWKRENEEPVPTSYELTVSLFQEP